MSLTDIFGQIFKVMLASKQKNLQPAGDFGAVEIEKLWCQNPGDRQFIG
jgi:hypothetical protein